MRVQNFSHFWSSSDQPLQNQLKHSSGNVTFYSISATSQSQLELQCIINNSKRRVGEKSTNNTKINSEWQKLHLKEKKQRTHDMKAIETATSENSKKGCSEKNVVVKKKPTTDSARVVEKKKTRKNHRNANKYRFINK